MFKQWIPLVHQTQALSLVIVFCSIVILWHPSNFIPAGLKAPPGSEGRVIRKILLFEISPGSQVIFVTLIPFFVSDMLFEFINTGPPV